MWGPHACTCPNHFFFSFSCFKSKCFTTTKIMYLYVSLWVIIVSSKTVPILKKGTNFRFIPFHTILNSCFQLSNNYLPILNAKKQLIFVPKSIKSKDCPGLLDLIERFLRFLIKFIVIVNCKK